jgi:hypothetical protein
VSLVTSFGSCGSIYEPNILPGPDTLTDTPQAVTVHPRASERDAYLEIPNTRRKQ